MHLRRMLPNTCSITITFTPMCLLKNMPYFFTVCCFTTMFSLSFFDILRIVISNVVSSFVWIWGKRGDRLLLELLRCLNINLSFNADIMCIVGRKHISKWQASICELWSSCTVKQVYCEAGVLWSRCTVKQVYSEAGVLLSRCIVRQAYWEAGVLRSRCTVKQVYCEASVLWISCTVKLVYSEVGLLWNWCIQHV